HILQLATLWYYADFDCYLWSYDFSPIVDPSTEMMDVMTTMSIDDGMSGLYWSNESFDQVYNASLGALDLSTRQDLVDQLQGLAHDDMGSQPVAYRERLFAANEAYWTNYGNWTEQFMLIPTYGAPWLYMQVRPPDTNPPSANAGEDLFVMGGVNVTLDGTSSTDDFGIVNYAWNFTYDGTEVVLTGMVMSFAFWIEGVYNVTLNVTDAAGNYDTDTVLVTVSGMIPELGIPALIVLGLAAVIVSFVRLRRRTRPD
ncbi:MAG: PKD domain-containing protein, partial [Thermoplasmata archaeon]|nr:PKD domain-containing protein [Thermoplasmata archaeon]